MAIRQYVGARYVTKIYENSLDPSSAEWEASVNYEPLTMVTYNNGSYLSKKEVPANIGDPASNPLYWTQTGFYNGQIASLTSRVTNIETGIKYAVPEQYGAIGDGVTDDTQALIDCFNDNKGKLIILSGRYLLTDSVKIYSGTYILGINQGTIIDSWNKLTYLDEDDKYIGLLDLDNQSNIVIDNVIFTGSVFGAAQTNIFLWAPDISGKNSNNIEIKNCIFDKCDLFTQLAFTSSSKINIHDNSFNWYRYQGIVLFECTYTNIMDNTFIDCGMDYTDSYGIAITYRNSGNYCQYVNCLNNVFTCPNYAPHECIDAHGGRDLDISGNSIFDAYDAIVIFSEYTRNFRIIRAKISNNKIYKATHCGIITGGYEIEVSNNKLMEVGSLGTGAVIKIISLCHTIKIAYNNITSCYYCAFDISTEASWSDKFVTALDITGNKIMALKAVNGVVKLLDCSAQFYYYSTFNDNIISFPSDTTVLFDTPATRFLDYILSLNRNTYIRTILDFNNHYANIAPDSIGAAEISSLENIGELGHLVTIKNQANNSGNDLLLVFNGSSYCKLKIS